MIISVPLSLLHMLLVGAPTTANAAFQSNNFARFRQTRLFAEDPYASLLNKVAPTTSDVATTAVTTPSPEPMLNAVDAQEKMNDIIQQINEAASSAMDAADKADQAAASIAVPAAAIKSAIAANVSAVAAAKAAAVAKAKEAAAAKAAAKAAAIAAAGSTGQTEKVPTLFEYITKLGSNESVDSGAANLAEMQEKLSLLKSNLIDGFSSLGNAPGVSNIKFPVVGAGTAAGVTYSSPDIQGLVENLHLEQYGAWYVTAASLLYASGQRQAGKEAAEKLFEEELTNAKLSAEEAAAAAALAAEGAKAAKDLVKNMPKVPTDNKILMESKLAQIALEKELTKKELLRLTAENEQLRQTIEKLSMQLNPAVVSAVGVEVPIVKERLPRDPDEDAKVLEILKEMDQMNSKKTVKKAAANAPSKAKAPAKSSKKSKVDDVSIPYDAAAKLAYEDSDKKMTFAKFKAKYEADAIDLVKSKRIPKSDSAEVAVTEKPKEKTVKKTATAKKAAPARKAAPTKKAAPAKKKATQTAENEANPWGALSESTLKRKTIAQLTEYLETRKIDVAGLSKADLVGTIQTL